MREIKFLVYLNTQEGVKRYSVNRIDYKRYGGFEITRIYYGDYYVIGDALKDGFAHLVQYTGLKDKNGREIYEGDIFEITFDQDVYHEELGDITIQRKDKEVVRFANGCFKVGYFPLSQVLKNKNHVRLIGNIYENPELLEGN